MSEEAQERLVMIPVDTSENSERAFDYYVTNIRRPNDKVLLFNAYEINHPTGFSLLGGGVYDDSVWNMETESAKNLLEGLKQKYKEKCEAAGNLPYEFQVHRVPVGEAIVDAAKQNNVELVVVGNRGLGTIRRTILGSVSDYVVQHSKIPVMVVP